MNTPNAPDSRNDNQTDNRRPAETLDVVIDRSKWRTGFDGPTAHGDGPTQLLNYEGYRCCLGFIASACGIDDEHLVRCSIPGLVSLPPYNQLPIELKSSSPIDYVSDALLINDNGYSTRTAKEQKLLDLFKKSSINLSFTGEYES